jgi:hypothetical protein
MVKVGAVYKSDGNVDLSSLPLKVKLSIFINHMIDSSYLLSGNMSKMQALKESAEKAKINNYTVAFSYYLLRSKYKNENTVVFVYNMDDEPQVRLALGNSVFFEYSKEFVRLNPDLVELEAFLSGCVIMRKLAL